MAGPARGPADGHAMDSTALIDALRAELAGYVRRGLTDRAAQVRQELDRLAGSAATTAETVPDEPVSTSAEAPESPPKARKAAKPPSTAKKPQKGKK